MSTLNPNIPSAELSRLMTTAAGKMKEYRLQWLTPQLLLRTFLAEKESTAFKILEQLRQQRPFDLNDLISRVETMSRAALGRDANFKFTDDFGKDVPLAEELLVVLDEALTIAKSRQELKATSGHVLAAMLQPTITTYAVLQRVGITAPGVIASLGQVTQDGTAVIQDYLTDVQSGKATAVYQRQDLLRDLIGLLSLSEKRHVILVGPEGAGKRTLAQSLAQLLIGKNAPKFRSLVQINETALLEDPLAAMRAGLRRATGGILIVPDINRFFADRLRAKFPEQVCRELQKALLNNEQVILGTATAAAYEQLNTDALIRQNTHRLDVPAATKDETLAMIVFHLPRLEQEYQLKVSWEALETAVTLADQYIKAIALPAAAIQLANRSCALVSMASQSHLPNTENITQDKQLDSEDVMLAVSQMTKIPLSKLNEDEQGKYANMVGHLQERLIGQSEAVIAVSRAVKTARVGLRDPKRPIGSFLFLGPSGVGKSELAKSLAEFMFGTEEAMLTLDMSEYQEEASVNRLIGPPPGYVGYEAGGQLTDFVRNRPYTVVLFDEVEKAHSRVLDVLLQVLDEGRLTDGQGRLTTFSETVIILTSNLGAKNMLVSEITEKERELVMAEVRSFFRPEFLNRMDDIILFHQLTPDELGVIFDLMLKKEFQLAIKQGIDLKVTPEAKKWLLAQNDQPEFGARPLRRLIGRYLREPLADFLLSHTRPKGQKTVVVISADEKGLQFKMGN